jgi:hypothetical protein
MSLTNFDIIDLCKQLDIPLIQCCPKNMLAGKPKNGAYIINLNNQGEEGSHWVCMYIRKNHCVYFDSFGCICPPAVSKFLLQSKIKTIYNVEDIQNIKDSYCGYYCIAFCCFMSCNKTPNLGLLLNNFTLMFNLNDTTNNHKIAFNYVTK